VPLGVEVHESEVIGLSLFARRATNRVCREHSGPCQHSTKAPVGPGKARGAGGAGNHEAAGATATDRPTRPPLGHVPPVNDAPNEGNQGTQASMPLAPLPFL